MKKIPKSLLIGIGFFAIVFIAFVFWVQGGSQKGLYPVPTLPSDVSYRIYSAKDSTTTLRLMHFISEEAEINVSSALIMGKKEIIVVTAQATKSSAERLVNEIQKTGLKLTYVILDHAHSDHSQGAIILKEHFPDAKFIAEPQVASLQHIRMEADDDRAIKRYGDNAAVPSVPFEPYESDRLMIDGYEIQLWQSQYGDVGLGHEDEPHTVVYIPALKALLPNDICYYKAHMMMGGSTNASRAKWKQQIKDYMQMDLDVVIPGHVVRNASHDMTAEGVLAFSLKYIEDYENALESSNTSDEVIAKMVELYPKIGHRNALYLGTYINFEEMHRLMFNPRVEKVASYLPKSFVEWADKRIFEGVKKSANH